MQDRPVAMAMASCGHSMKFLFRCRRCRHGLLFDDKATVESGCPLCSESEGHSQVWYIQEDAVPAWIQTCIEESSWTRGKLLCPKCSGRLGSFDFTMQPRCRQGHMLPCVHLVKSRVDRAAAAPPVARVKPFQQEEGLWSNAIPGPEVSICPLGPKSRVGEDSSHDRDSSGTSFHSSSDLHAFRENAARADHISSHCHCQQQELTTCSDHLHAFPVDRVNIQSHSHSCCLANDQFFLHLAKRDWNVCTSHSASHASCTGASRGLVHCCHCSCLSETRLHSHDPTKPQHGIQTVSGEDLAATNISESCRGGGGGDIHCNQNLTKEDRYACQLNHHHPCPEIAATMGASSFKPVSVIRPERIPVGDEEIVPSATLLQEDSEDLLHDWDVLEELEELNSSILSYQLRAEARRERNRRKKLRRKLRRWGNSHPRIVDGDVKGLQPSKFEEVTGLSLGDKTIQEYTICAVCLDLFFNPRACSPCGHLFCEQCLRQLTRFNPTSTPCPLCRTVIQVTIPHEGLSDALYKLFPTQMRQRKEAFHRVKQHHPLPRAQDIPSVWLPIFGQQILSGRERRRMFWSLQSNSSLDYHDFGRLWVQTLRWRFTVAGYGLLALLLVCACSVLVMNFV